MTKYNSSETIKALSSIIAIDDMSDSDKLDIIKRIIEIVNVEIDKTKNKKTTDKDGWYLWDAKKENVDYKFTPEHIKGKRIEVRYVNGQSLVPGGLAETFGFSDDYEGYNIAAYRIIE